MEDLVFLVFPCFHIMYYTLYASFDETTSKVLSVQITWLYRKLLYTDNDFHLKGALFSGKIAKPLECIGDIGQLSGTWMAPNRYVQTKTIRLSTISRIYLI